MGYNTKEDNVVRFALDDLLDDLYGQKLSPHERQLRGKIKRYFLRFCSCGNEIGLDGNLIKVFCRNPSCKPCSKFFARKQADSLYKQCNSDNHDQYRMVTCIIDVSDRIDDMFQIYANFRKKVRDVIRRKRDGKKPIALEYQNLAIAGSLEIDSFDIRDIYELGNEKQEQYIQNFGLKLDCMQDTVWVCTFHGIVHVSNLSEQEIASLFKKASSVVHIRKLDKTQTVNECLRNVIGYASKVSFSTTYKSGIKRSWPIGDIRQYLEYVCLHVRGRMGFKFFMGPKGKRAKN